jgi:hypothetical protein
MLPPAIASLQECRNILQRERKKLILIAHAAARSFRSTIPSDASIDEGRSRLVAVLPSDPFPGEPDCE